MSDPGKYRTREEVQETRENRDPIERLRTILINNNFCTETELTNSDKSIRDEVAEAADNAKDMSQPDKKELYEDVYADQIIK